MICLAVIAEYLSKALKAQINVPIYSEDEVI